MARYNTPHAEYVAERDRFLVRLGHGIGSLLLETIDGAYSCHQAVGYVHQHGGSEEEGAHAQHGHYPDQVNHDDVKGTVLVGAEELVPTEQGEVVGGAGPGVDQNQHEVLFWGGFPGSRVESKFLHLRNHISSGVRVKSSLL